MNLIFELCDSSVILFMLGKNLLKRVEKTFKMSVVNSALTAETHGLGLT